MTAYLIAEVDVHDPDRYEEYKRLAPGAIEACGGKYLVRGGETTLFEGDQEPKRVVILEFESMEKAQAFVDSEEYREIKAIRHATAVSRIFGVEGI